jgi:hypothetical protein
MPKNQNETVLSSASQNTAPLAVFKESSALEKIGNFIKQYKAIIGGALIFTALATLIFAPYLIPALAPILAPVLSALGVGAIIASVASFIESLGVAAWITAYTACAIVGGALVGIIAGKLINKTGRLMGRGLEWVKNTFNLFGSSSPQPVESSSPQAVESSSPQPVESSSPQAAAESLTAQQIPPETTNSTTTIFCLLEKMSLEVQTQIIGGISSILSLKDFGQLVQTNHGVGKLFTIPQLLTSRLLQHVAFGEQMQAEYILKCLNPTSELGLLKGNVTDYSARTFTNISPFQYAAWALDRHMWTPILKYTPHQNEKALAQLTELEEGKGKHGAHYDFIALINAMKVYFKHCNKKREGEYVWSEDECVEHWNKVTATQRSVPAHVVNEYCRGDRSFSLKADFNEENLPRTFSVFDPRTQKHSLWFPITSNVDQDSDCGMYSGGLSRLQAYVGTIPDENYARFERGVVTVQVDLEAIKTLWKTRTADLVKLKEQLQNLPTLLPIINKSVFSFIKRLA